MRDPIKIYLVKANYTDLEFLLNLLGVSVIVKFDFHCFVFLVFFVIQPNAIKHKLCAASLMPVVSKEALVIHIIT